MRYKTTKVGPVEITFWCESSFGFSFVLYMWHVANLWYKLRKLTTRSHCVCRRDFVNTSIHFLFWRVHILWAGSGTIAIGIK